MKRFTSTEGGKANTANEGEYDHAHVLGYVQEGVWVHLTIVWRNEVLEPEPVRGGRCGKDGVRCSI